MIGNPNHHRSVEPSQMGRSESMFRQATNQSAGFRNQMKVDPEKNPQIWGASGQRPSDPKKSQKWLTPQVKFQNGRQLQQDKWDERSMPFDNYNEDKMGLSNMSSKDPQDHHFDKRYWYGKHYANMKNAGGQAHQEDLGKQLLTSDFFAYLERKKELEFEKEYEMFKLNQVDLSTPAERDFWQKKMPELYQKKMEFYRIQSQLEAIRAEINARGPQNNQDLYFMYLDGLGAFQTADLDTINLYLENRGLDWLWNAAVRNGALYKPGNPPLVTYDTDKESVNAVPLHSNP